MNPTLANEMRELLNIREADPHILGLYMGPPGSGRSVLCNQYAYELLKAGAKLSTCRPSVHPQKYSNVCRGMDGASKSFSGRA
jgi:hypothetical protein